MDVLGLLVVRVITWPRCHIGYTVLRYTHIHQASVSPRVLQQQPCNAFWWIWARHLQSFDGVFEKQKDGLKVLVRRSRKRNRKQHVSSLYPTTPPNIPQL